MLKGSTTEVKQAFANHVLEYYPNIEDLVRDCKAAGGAVELVEGGCFLVYTYDVDAFLRDAYQSTEDDCKKFNPEKAWEVYKYKMALTIDKIIEKYNA